MSLGHGASVVRSGLVLHLDAYNLTKHGTSPYRNLAGSGTIINTGFTVVNNIFRTDANPVSGSGTSEMLMSGFEITSGSFSLNIWLNVTSNPDTGANNNWRSVFNQNGTGQSPFGIYLEQNRELNYSLQTTIRSYRFIDGAFTQGFLPLNQWSMIVFQYDKTTGIASAYQNGLLIRSGFMTTDTIKSVSSTPAEGVVNLTTAMSMNLSNNNPTADPNGAGCFPGDFGPCLLYNRSLTPLEVNQNFEAIRGRYSI